jgi:phosphate transport system permease protein
MRPASVVGDRFLFVLCALAGVAVAFVLGEVVYQVINGAQPALSAYGFNLLTHTLWQPNFFHYGALAAIYGTVVTSLIALLISAPLGIAIGLYLAMMAPPVVRRFVGPLVEMLAAIPSVIVGFWGVVVLAPFIASTVEPVLHDVLGFIPLFGPPQTTGLSIFTAGVGLTVMVLPIIAALSRDLFLTVPQDLRDGAAALGASEWEVIRGVVLPTTLSGVAAAIVLGLGRALGEAIAVVQMVGDGSGISKSLFMPGNTLTTRIATEFQSGAQNRLDFPSVFYLALILLVIGLVTSVAARAITARFDVHRAVIAR